MKREAAMIPGTIPLGGAGYDEFMLVLAAVVAKETLGPASKGDLAVLANTGISVRFMGTRWVPFSGGAPVPAMAGWLFRSIPGQLALLLP